MAKEKPIRIEKTKRGHTETRWFAREIREDWCADEACEFFGRRAQQGVCYSERSWIEEEGEFRHSWAHVENATKIGEGSLKEIRDYYFDKKRHKGKSKLWRKDQFLDHLSSGYVTAWVNEVFRLDELVWLRRELALAKLKIEKLEAKIEKLEAKKK